jgi:pimeloyl-ACP methyl ester carboxylesterase
MSAVEREYITEGFCFAVKEWHSQQPKKILALHGWLDNAASFDAVAPLLKEFHVVAVDLPGHGLSDHRPMQASYNIWDDLVDLSRLIDALDWQDCVVLGHSRGAMIGLLLAVTQSKKVSALIGLDALTPQPKSVAESPQQLIDYVNGNLSLSKKRLPGYSHFDAAVKARMKASGMPDASARVIVERGLRKEGDVYRWTTDARLMLSSALRLTAEHNQAFVAALAVPCLVLLAENGLVKHYPLLEEIESYNNISHELLPGSHHFHMEAQAPLLAEKICRFLA